MVTFKYSLDTFNRTFSINASANPTYNGVHTECEARVACARKLDERIAAHREKMAKDIADLTKELNDLEGLRNSVYVGELPSVQPPTPKSA